MSEEERNGLLTLGGAAGSLPDGPITQIGAAPFAALQD